MCEAEAEMCTLFRAMCVVSNPRTESFGEELGELLWQELLLAAKYSLVMCLKKKKKASVLK